MRCASLAGVVAKRGAPLLSSPLTQPPPAQGGGTRGRNAASLPPGWLQASRSVNPSRRATPGTASRLPPSRLPPGNPALRAATKACASRPTLATRGRTLERHDQALRNARKRCASRSMLETHGRTLRRHDQALRSARKRYASRLMLETHGRTLGRHDQALRAIRKASARQFGVGEDRGEAGGEIYR
jgi:hypothetical protein